MHGGDVFALGRWREGRIGRVRSAFQAGDVVDAVAGAGRILAAEKGCAGWSAVLLDEGVGEREPFVGEPVDVRGLVEVRPVVEAGLAVQESSDLAGIALPYGKLNGQNLQVWINLLWGHGGDLFNEDGSPAFNSEAGVTATQQFIDLLLTHEIVPVGAAAYVEQDAVNSFKQGNSAMLPLWWWVRSQLTDPEESTVTEEQLGVTALPAVTGSERTTFTNTWIFGVTEGSRNRDAAIEYLGWLTDPAIERDVLLDEDLNETVAVHFSNLRDPEVNARWGGIHQAAADALATAPGMGFDADWPRISEILENAISSLASGESDDVAAVLDAAAEEISRIR